MAVDEGGRAGVRTMKASEFKAKCLKLMDEVAETGEEILITKRGRAVAKLLPVRRRQGRAVRSRSRHHQDPTATSARRLTWSGMQRRARTGLSRFDSAGYAGLALAAVQ